MARIGNNPNRQALAVKYPPVVAGIVTHLPNETEQYHRGRMDAIKTCLITLRKHAGQEIGVMVWDNGSCDRLKDWLQNVYKPDWLVLSPNIGKAQARCSMYRMLPFDTVFCFSDDDMFYYPNWLLPQMQLLYGFPHVGVVSGYPVRSQFNWGCKRTIEWAEKNGKVTKGKLIPEEWDIDFCESVGRTMETHKKIIKDTVEVMVEYQDLQAYCTAHHCQFIAKVGVLEKFITWSIEYAMSDEKPFDTAIDAAGLLRLTTVHRYTRHIGNVLDFKFKNEMTKLGVKINGK
jgi:hypothetical protein